MRIAKEIEDLLEVCESLSLNFNTVVSCFEEYTTPLWILNLSLSFVTIFIQSCPLFNPLSAKSDKHQFSPNDINMQSREEVMRIDKMITKGKMLWSFFKFSQLIQ